MFSSVAANLRNTNRMAVDKSDKKLHFCGNQCPWATNY